MTLWEKRSQNLRMVAELKIQKNKLGAGLWQVSYLQLNLADEKPALKTDSHLICLNSCAVTEKAAKSDNFKRPSGSTSTGDLNESSQRSRHHWQYATYSR